MSTSPGSTTTKHISRYNSKEAIKNAARERKK